MVIEALLIWLITYVSFLAVFGFILFIARSFSGGRWGHTAILRTASLLAFIGATASWVLLVIVD